MSQLKFVRRVLYRLKRRYGQPLIVIDRTTTGLNIQTGVKTIAKVGHDVKRALIFPASIQTQFFFDLAYIAAAKDFSYGTQVEHDMRKVIIDRRDLTLEINTTHYIIYKNKRYDVKKVEDFELNAAYIVTMQQNPAAERSAVFNVKVEDVLTTTETVST